MDESLKLKGMDREMVELLVSEELGKFMKKVSLAVIEGFSGNKLTLPETRPTARKIIAIVKEHSV